MVDETTVDETFIAAGSEWELGNAVPLVEVRGQGGLVMRRADERWALADITTSTNFALEVDVDFRTGPGFGVLFHASTDADSHMSGLLVRRRSDPRRRQLPRAAVAGGS